AGYAAQVEGAVPRQEWIQIPGGLATLGLDRGAIAFGWDNERPGARTCVNAFEIERHNVTNAAFLEFVDAGGYRDARWWRREDWQWLQADNIRHPSFWERHDEVWHWRGMFDLLPLPLSWPVFVTQAEAHAYAAWRGVRLPTEAEF